MFFSDILTVQKIKLGYIIFLYCKMTKMGGRNIVDVVISKLD